MNGSTEIPWLNAPESSILVFPTTGGSIRFPKPKSAQVQWTSQFNKQEILSSEPAYCVYLRRPSRFIRAGEQHILEYTWQPPAFLNVTSISSSFEFVDGNDVTEELQRDGRLRRALIDAAKKIKAEFGPTAVLRLKGTRDPDLDRQDILLEVAVKREMNDNSLARLDSVAEAWDRQWSDLETVVIITFAY